MASTKIKFGGLGDDDDDDNLEAVDEVEFGNDREEDDDDDGDDDDDHVHDAQDGAEETAQAYLVRYLASQTSRQLESLHLTQALEGPLDFAVLKQHPSTRGIHTIHLEPGTVTALDHLPDTLQTLICRGNRLTSLRVPASVVHLDLSSNMLSNLRFAKDAKLKFLNVSDNDFQDELPHLAFLEDLEELYVTNNQLMRLDLQAQGHLRVLHTRGNRPNLVVEHVPPHCKTDDDLPAAAAASSDDVDPLFLDQQEQLLKYFKLRETQDALIAKTIQTWKRDLKGQSPSVLGTKIREWKTRELPCPFCKRKGQGLVFERRPQSYTAHCGALKNRCQFELQVELEPYIPMDVALRTAQMEFDTAIEAILRQKCLSLFRYDSVMEAKKKFDAMLETYQLSLFEYETTKRGRLAWHPLRHRQVVVDQERVLQSMIQAARDRVQEWHARFRDHGDAEPWTPEAEVALKTLVQEMIETDRPRFLQEIKVLNALLFHDREIEVLTDALNKPTGCRLHFLFHK